MTIDRDHVEQYVKKIMRRDLLHIYSEIELEELSGLEKGELERLRAAALRVYARPGVNHKSKRKGTGSAALVSFVDLIPGPRTRKLVRKMVADQLSHVHMLRAAGRFSAANWVLFCSWILVAWYCATHFVSEISRAIRGRLKS